MSEQEFTGPGGRLPFEALSAAGGTFRSDARFSSAGAAAPMDAPRMPEPEPEDPLAMAFAEGYATGAAEAQAQADERTLADAAAREGLTLSFAKLDRDLEEELRQRLRDTVAALCEAAIAPLALDQDALLRRVERAVSLLARADDERVVRLHPDDIVLLSERFAADWQVVPDPLLERGALRVESANGGIEDGPDLWRREIAEALRQC
ncbi:flagellar assembly protein FliH [Novosphingobium sp. G106]|uniref:FliH/SctL family protein n=1 Tax=Novosphingobium sp. G106 TaxID=2849500 RepID=UPI001C2D6AD6|nr:FliH/SctL family protein [Novosphingobium sp. G106]MBV1690686.1 flagellar assembly protein FliH [Novosphingobium sp. G106]